MTLTSLLQDVARGYYYTTWSICEEWLEDIITVFVVVVVARTDSLDFVVL